MVEAIVQISRHGPVALLTLNRPEAMNALSQAMRRALCATLDDLDREPGVAACVLTGAGDRAFCAGLDLKEIRSNPAIVSEATSDKLDQNPALRLAAFTKPVIAAVNGVAITGGFELMLSCDIVLAADTARFSDTHARVGLLPAWGLSQKLSRLIGPYRAKELSLTGRFLSVTDAVAWGLVNRAVDAADLLETAIGMARQISEADPAIVRANKRLIDLGYQVTLEQGLNLETSIARAHNPA
jgi:enoyl-CoA hydratase